MAKKAKPIISIRVTEKEKETIQKLATDNGLTVTDYLKQKALYDLETDSNTSNTQEVQRLTDVLNERGLRVTDLEDQLEQANRRIDDYSRQLEQQQSLQLASHTTNKELQHKLDTLEGEQQQRKGFFSRLFSGN